VRDFLFTFAIGLSLLILQTSAIGFWVSAFYKPDLVLVLVCWAGLRLTILPGIGFSFGIGILVDLLSGSPMGLFALIYSVVFLVCGYLEAILDINGHLGRAVTVFGATVFSGAVMILMRWLSEPLELTLYTAWGILLKATVGGLAAILFIPALDRLRAGSTRLIGVS
jgi:rod shape-determining protein MreD